MKPEQYEARKQELLEEIAEIQRREEQYRKDNAIEFFEPWPYQNRILDYIDIGKMVITLQGANGIGKSHLGGFILGSAGLGVRPWDGKPTRWGRNPVKMRVICSDWEKHADKVIVPKLHECFPKGTYTTSKNNVGVEAFWKFPDTGSTIEILTDKQDTRDHEGWEGDLVWADEPFSRDKFVANLRGLRKGKGLFLITLTMTSEFWIWDDIINNPDPAYARVIGITQNDAPHLDEEYKRTFAASLTEREKIARVYGGCMNLIDLVWPEFRLDPIDGKISHIIDDFNVFTDWPVVPIIDYHPSAPQAIGYYAVDPHDRSYVIDEEWGPNWSPEMTADAIIRKKKQNAWRTKDVFIDPLSKGDTAYIKNRGIEIPDAFTVIEEKLWKDERIELHIASKDQASGIVNIRKILKDVNGLPMLFFFRSLIGKTEKEGHIWEIQRWTYGENGKPKENFHFMENLYRMTLTGIKYTVPVSERQELRYETDFSVFEESQYGVF